jgi:hypothetical protein
MRTPMVSAVTGKVDVATWNSVMTAAMDAQWTGFGDMRKC